MNPDDPRVQRFLRKSMVARLATLSPAGRPHLTPLWFVLRRGRIYMTTRDRSPAVRNICAHPEVALLFHGERRRRSGRVMLLRGRAAFTPGRSAIASILPLSIAKYYLSPGGLWDTLANLRRFLVRGRYYAERADQGGVIEITAESAEFLPQPLV
jgi:uncharacterized pyridoxamine 5'-phosphate oxidase family protein